MIKRMDTERYRRLVPEARDINHPTRANWGIGEHVFYIGKEKKVFAEVVEWLTQSDKSYFIQDTTHGLFIEFQDDIVATLFRIRFE